MTITEPICFKCKHYDETTATCKAFINEIPDVIYYGDNDHSRPLPEQENNIIFEPINEQEQ